MTPTAPPPEKPTAPPSFPEPKPSTPVETGRAETLARLADAIKERACDVVNARVDRACRMVEHALIELLGEPVTDTNGFTESATCAMYALVDNTFRAAAGNWRLRGHSETLAKLVAKEELHQTESLIVQKPLLGPGPGPISDDEMARRISTALRDAFKDLPGVQLVLHPRVDLKA